MGEPVVIVPYDPTWPSLFAQLRDGIVAALGATALRVEHVGSTSVPGLAAKPIIDIDAVIPAETDLPEAIRKLARVGYTHEGERGIAGRHAFSQPSGLPAHHLYVCDEHNPELWRHIAFRDYLRANPAEAASYGALKERLALRFGNDRDGYTDAKSAFIAEALSKLPQKGSKIDAARRPF